MEHVQDQRLGGKVHVHHYSLLPHPHKAFVKPHEHRNLVDPPSVGSSARLSVPGFHTVGRMCIYQGVKKKNTGKLVLWFPLFQYEQNTCLCELQIMNCEISLILHTS